MKNIEENKKENNLDNYQIIKDFHAVDFMRKIRNKISKEIQDKSLNELNNYFNAKSKPVN
jgi:hypothetical protein